MKAINRVVSTSFWEDETVVNDFSPEDKYFYLYLLTNPHTTQLGIYKLVPKTAAFELGYSKEAVIVLLDRFESKYGMIRYSQDTCEVAIKNYLRHSVVKGGKPVFDCLLKEESRVVDESLLRYVYSSVINKNNLNNTVREYLNHLGNKLNDISIPNDNDNDNENERIVNESSTYRYRIANEQEIKPAGSRVIKAWNELSDIGIKPVRGVSSGSKRNETLRARIREYGEDTIIEAIGKIRNSDFLQGDNNRGWMITFDWFLLPSNFQKVLEGNYDNSNHKHQGSKKEPMGNDAFMAIMRGEI